MFSFWMGPLSRRRGRERDLGCSLQARLIDQKGAFDMLLNKNVGCCIEVWIG